MIVLNAISDLDHVQGAKNFLIFSIFYRRGFSFKIFKLIYKDHARVVQDLAVAVQDHAAVAQTTEAAHDHATTIEIVITIAVIAIVDTIAQGTRKKAAAMIGDVEVDRAAENI